MNPTQNFEFARILIFSENRETNQRPMGRNSAQRLTHSDAWPSLWPRHSGARGPLAESAHDLCGLPTDTAREARARTEAVIALRVRVVAWPAAALPWLRWGARASTVEGTPTGQVGEGGRSPELIADGKGRKNRDGGGVLRRGGCSGGRRGPASGWEGRGGSGAAIPSENGRKGGGCSRLRSPWSGSRRWRRSKLRR
jgi:hypothetical protein